MFQRVALVHDWLIAMRGGERVLESLSALYPDADIFTLRHDPSQISPALSRHRVTTSFIDRLARTPVLRGRFRGLLPLFPLAAESFPLAGYDLVISSSHCVAAGVLAPPEALHVAYLHSPMRYAWEGQAAYEAGVRGGAVGRWAFRAAAHYLRLWDVAASARPDLLIANSTYTRDRVRRYYRREAEVIEPPIDTRRFAAAEHAASGTDAPPEAAPLLVVSALVPYKRVELAVRAMAGRPEHLVIVGDGPERRSLERLAASQAGGGGAGNVSFRGWVGDDELVSLFGRCRALLHPAVDDFGMVMVEALAAGKPVVAAREGGAVDIVRSGETGILFDEPTVESLRAALDRLALALQGRRFDAGRLRSEARRFDRATFESRFHAAVERAAVERAAAANAGQAAPARRDRGLKLA